MTRSAAESVHFQPTEPGGLWQKDPDVVIDVLDAPGMWRIITPNVVQFASGYRMYYTESGPGMEYRTSAAAILSAYSKDGLAWDREPRVRLAPQEPLAGLRVVCPDVIPLPGDGYRMYFEGQPHEGPSSVMSAVSPEASNGRWSREYGSGTASTHTALRGASMYLWLTTRLDTGSISTGTGSAAARQSGGPIL